MVVVDGEGIPLGGCLVSASPNEVTLIETTLEQVAVPRAKGGRPKKNPKRLIYDKAGDSDPLRDRLEKRGIDFICPHRKTGPKPNGRTAENSGVTANAGKLNAPSPGWETFGDSLSAGTEKSRFIRLFSIWLASSLHWGGFETSSSGLSSLN
jgi:hypothetical protein